VGIDINFTSASSVTPFGALFYGSTAKTMEREGAALFERDSKGWRVALLRGR